MQVGYTGIQKGKVVSVETVISLQRPLFAQVEALACEMQVSRNHLFVLAMEQFIEHHQNQKLLEEINAAYEDMPDPAEQDLQQRMHRQHRRLVEGQSKKEGVRCEN